VREALSLNEGDELLLIPTEEGILMKRPSGPMGLRGLLKDLDVNIEECEAILAEAKRSLTTGIDQ
jgi:bifunctional DNA-binding transcriptional regulator/antitoxin component of YhaV-PrlF toxin-antitoxin module